MKCIVVATTAVAALAAPAYAQNTTGVFGPNVDPDDHTVEYRIAAVTDDGDWGQRIHYQRSLNDRLRPRLIVATRSRGGNEVDLDFVRAELVWQTTPDDAQWSRGWRFEARFRDEGAEEIRANLINQWSLGDGWRARAIFLNTLQVADRSNDNLQFQTRLGVSRKLDSGIRLGVHGYFDLGDTSDVRVLDGVESELGPFVGFNLTDDVGVYLGTLHGVAGDAADNQLRLFIDRSF